jgi:hypothetical protein
MDYVLLFVSTLRGQETSYETFKTSELSTLAPRIMSAHTTIGLSRSDLNERRLLRRTQRLRRQESGMYAYCSMNISLFYVFYVPDLQVNVISVEKLKVDNYVGYTSWPHSLFDGETLQTFVIADSTRGIPTIDMNHLVKPNINAAQTAIMNPTINYNEAKDQEITLELAHRRLGHISMPQVKRLLNGKSLGMTLSSQDMHTCEGPQLISKIVERKVGAVDFLSIQLKF